MSQYSTRSFVSLNLGYFLCHNFGILLLDFFSTSSFVVIWAVMLGIIAMKRAEELLTVAWKGCRIQLLAASFLLAFLDLAL